MLAGIAALMALIIFFGCWIYAIASFGLFIGLAFGWIPAAIITILFYGPVNAWIER